MPDLRDILDAEARRIGGKGTLGSVLRRAAHRRLIRRIASGVLALAVAGAGFGLAYAAFRPAGDVRPGGPLPGPTTSVSPDPAVFKGLSIGNRSSEEGAAEFARALLASEGVTADLTLLRAREETNDITTIHFHPSREAYAIVLRDRFFPGAELRPRIDPKTLLIAVGDDFLRHQEGEFELFKTIRSFLTRRVEGDGAETFLSGDAAEQYATGRDGLSLYEYTQGGGFQLQVFRRGADGTAVVEAVMWTPPAADVVVLERLTVGDHDPEDGRPEILAAELVSPKAAFAQVREFVRGFLEARQEASGAGTYLGEDAREAYGSHEDGLDLLRYAADERLANARIIRYTRLGANRNEILVRFTLSRPVEPLRVYELLTIDWLGEDDLVVADAERVSSVQGITAR